MQFYLKVLKNYALFDGRARRKEYWHFFLVSTLISVGLIFLGNFIGLDWAYNVYSLAVLVPSIAVGVRRMHDVGKSGWYILIPLYNFILACTKGERHTNKYGPDPKSDSPDFDFEQPGNGQLS